MGTGQGTVYPVAMPTTARWIVISDQAAEKAEQGEVLAVGSGRRLANGQLQPLSAAFWLQAVPAHSQSAASSNMAAKAVRKRRSGRRWASATPAETVNTPPAARGSPSDQSTRPACA